MILEDLQAVIRTALKNPAASFTYPPRPELGDLSLACFELAKSRQEAPAKTATDLAAAWSADPELKKYFLEIRAVGPYLNFFIDPAFLATNLIPAIRQQKSNYGLRRPDGRQRVMVEYSNGNTHKEYHVGHLRNITYGDAIVRLLQTRGQTVFPVSYINDFGIHVAKTIWNWQRDKTFSERPEPKGYLLGRCYAKASQALDDNPEGQAEVGRIMQEIESRRGAAYRLWEKTRRWSIAYFQSIYKELGIKFVHTFYESEVIEAGRRLVEKLQAQDILIKSQGAIIADLEKYGLGVLPVIRSDGTALYPVADLALASEKFDRYKLDESIYVVDVRQSLYFKQLFKVLSLMGYEQPLVHLPYDFVTLPSGMMASRTGNVITYRELHDQVKESSLEETGRRHPRWSARRLNRVAERLAVATLKFEMLKVGANKIITFNIKEALRFDGYTACYLEYGYARLRSIIRKSHSAASARRSNLATLTEAREKELMLRLARYPETVSAAAAAYDPSVLAKYLFELVQLSNDYYHEINILKAPTPQRRARLALIAAVAQVLKNGLALLGLSALEEM